jgi:hypothetical protein
MVQHYEATFAEGLAMKTCYRVDARPSACALSSELTVYLSLTKTDTSYISTQYLKPEFGQHIRNCGRLSMRWGTIGC